MTSSASPINIIIKVIILGSVVTVDGEGLGAAEVRRRWEWGEGEEGGLDSFEAFVDTRMVG
ncbi:hypothetical protein AAHE18_01G094200 [Arachis hypogaea]